MFSWTTLVDNKIQNLCIYLIFHKNQLENLSIWSFVSKSNDPMCFHKLKIQQRDNHFAVYCIVEFCTFFTYFSANFFNRELGAVLVLTSLNVIRYQGVQDGFRIEKKTRTLRAERKSFSNLNQYCRILHFWTFNQIVNFFYKIRSKMKHNSIETLRKIVGCTTNYFFKAII